ncbi:MAG: hypothetical protein FVQ82_02440 [Planctomycetes bacterium]|nr:hypothetical protein [Planctomycetota bacterium]
MKRYLLLIAILIFCFGMSATLCADPNEPNSVSDPNDLTEPNIPKVITKPEIPAAPAEVADPVKSYPTIENAIKLLNSGTGSQEPNEPNDPGSVVDVVVEAVRKLPDVVSVSISPATDLPQFKYRLLPLDMERSDGDAAELYVKAIDALPADFSQSAINAMLDAPMDKFNTDIAASIVKPCANSLDLIARGSLLRQCQWPKDQAGKGTFSLLKGLNSLTSVVALKARLDTSVGEYKTAVKAIRDGLAMSRHIANTPSMIQTMAAANTASVMLKSVEELVQSPKAPSLYRSLSDLPKPLVNLSMPPAKTEDNSKNRRRSGHYITLPGRMGGKGRYKIYVEDEFEDEPDEPAEEPTHSRKDILLQMNKLDRLVAALQCLEGIRYYAALHGGKLPASLNDISDLSLPLDPVTQRPFRYALGKDIALLGSPVTRKQADHESTIYFEIKARSASAGIKSDQTKD